MCRSNFFFPNFLLRAAKSFCSSSPAREPLQYTANSSPPLSSISITSKTPLFLRTPSHVTSLSEVWKWHDWAKDLASFVDDDSSTSSNDSLDSEILQRELKWLIEDSIVADPLVILHRSESTDDGKKNVKLRDSLEELYELWRQRIENRRPFQYVVGCEHWRDLVLCVEEGVLIPRPETELIVDMVEELVTRDEGFKNGLWADLRTGSGAIAIGIAKVLGSHGRVIATDLSPVAIGIAGYNVQRYGLQQIVDWRLYFDLREVKPNEFVRYGIGYLETVAAQGDECAKECRARLRIMVAGGDGMLVGFWVATELQARLILFVNRSMCSQLHLLMNQCCYL